MHKTAREKRSEFNSGARMYRKKFCTTFIFFGKNVFEKIFRPRLWHLRWCQMIAQRSPKLFGKTSFLTPKTFSEHVRNMSKTCLLSCLILSYIVLSYHITSYNIIWNHMISYDIIWHHMTSYDIIWYHMISSTLRSKGKPQNMFMNFTKQMTFK